MLHLIKFDSSRPVIARAAGRGFIAHINFALRNICERLVRQSRFGVATPEVATAEGTGVDGANDALAAEAEHGEEGRTRAEQGFDVNMPLEEQAALMKLVRDYVAQDLLENAAQTPMLTDPNKTMADPFHTGATFAESISWALNLKANMPSEARIAAEAKALNVTVADIRRVVLDRHATQIQFLKENQEDIVARYEGLVAKGKDGHPYGYEDIENVFDRLPAMSRVRMYKAADQGLWKQRDRELAKHLGIAPRPQNEEPDEAAGNIALLDGTRRQLLDDLAKLMNQPTFKREIDEAIARGARLPQFAPAPHVQQADEKDRVMQQRKAA